MYVFFQKCYGKSFFIARDTKKSPKKTKSRKSPEKEIENDEQVPTKTRKTLIVSKLGSKKAKMKQYVTESTGAYSFYI